MENIVDFLNGIIWSNAMIILALGSGLYYSLRGRFLQLRHIKEMARLLLVRGKVDKGVSSFQALALSVAGRVGTGNIAGVATAIALGGPGSIFWMWVIAFLGASTSFVECTLGQIYKEDDNGQYRGGPAYFIEKGIGIKWYALAFAIATVFAFGLCTPGVQANAIAASLNNAFGITPMVTGSILVVGIALIIFGGVKRISRVAEIVVPFMAIAYILIALLVIAMNITKLPSIIALIVKSAFAAESAFAGMVGSAIAWGVRRGIYSNESGMGSAVQAAAAAEVSHPAKQGLVQAFSVYIDTLFVCSATAFMILITGMYNVENPAGGFIVNNLPGIEIGPVYTQKAMESVFSSFGGAFVAISLLFFAFTTILGNYYAAETNMAYINKKIGQKWLITVLRIATLIAVFTGAFRTAKLAWAIGDVGVGAMTWLTLIAIMILSNIAFKVLKDYEEQKAAGKDPKFDPKKLDIKNADIWIEEKEDA
ncbi:alanine/glycine:cation symporter family protein [Clostridiisalibacter paucivorans]|uniref:alanine/glycine:cation symporter family protein n=1 Tax=Clostridiisalibacter paucivorans TaxID=408753 RepID=UPI000479E6B0|nr:alanine/glycine:cation symporter family protein [Clostridiisalibacter paucivorans]